MPPYDGSLSQRSFEAGELTPAMWARVDASQHAKGLKTARNGYIMRQGGFTNRPGTVMVAPVKNSSAGRIRLISFVFSNFFSYVLEFGQNYMRVYRNGVQIQATDATPWSATQAYVIGNMVSYNGAYYYAVAPGMNVVPPNAVNWYPLMGQVFEIPTPYSITDVPKIQVTQNRNVMYIVCAGHPVYQLTCAGDDQWSLAQMMFTPQTPMPGSGQTVTTPTFADPAGLYPWFGATSGYLNFPNSGSNPGHWNAPWDFLPLNGRIIPGQNGFPVAGTDDVHFGLDQNRYMITATDAETGIESFPMPGSISGWYVKSEDREKIADGNPDTVGEGEVDADVNYYSRFNSANEQVINSFVPGFPLTVRVTDTSTFLTGDFFQFQGTGNQALDGQVFQGQVSTGQVSFLSIDGSNYSALAPDGSILACLTSQVISAALYPEAGMTPSGNVASSYVGGQPIESPTSSQVLMELLNPTESIILWVDQNGWQGITLAFLAKFFVYGPLTLTWEAPSATGNYVYNIYRLTAENLWGLIGVSETTTFTDTGTVPDTSKFLPNYTAIGAGQIGNPSVIGMFQQRLLLANTDVNEDWIYASNTGRFNVFTTTQPAAVESDTVQFEVAGTSYNAVTQLVDNAFLLIFTETGEFSCYGAGSAYSAGPITPTAIGLVQQGFYGANQLLKPISIGKNVLHVQTLQSKVRELQYTYMLNGYLGDDLTINSQHLFDGYTILDWCYQQEPNSLVWAVRDDGALLCMCYLPELQIRGWSRCDTLGSFENVCAIPEGTETALYVVVNRNGTRFVERFANQVIPQVQDTVYITEGRLAGKTKSMTVPDVNAYCYMDCSSYYDGRNTAPCKMNFNTGDPTANGSGFILSHGTSGGGWDYFTPDMVGKAIILHDPADGSVYTCTILQYISRDDAFVRPNLTLPASMTAQWVITQWALAVNVVSGLSQFPDGTPVSVIADGAVLSSPATETMLTVQGGAVQLPGYYSFVRVGLPYFSDMRSLNIDTNQQGMTSQDKPQLINRVGIYFEKSRGVWVGAEPPIDDNTLPLENLEEYKTRTCESLGHVPVAHTGIEIAAVDAKFAFGANVFVRQPNPLPMTVLSMVPAGKFMMGG